MNYEAILRAAAENPWAIDERKLNEIQAFLTVKASGFKISKKRRAEIEAASQRAPTRARASKVAMIPIYGTIMPKANIMSEFSGGCSLQQASQALAAAVADPSVKAIVLDVDSPGGNVVGVQEFADEVFAARSVKKIYAVANNQMASAAYWIASQANEIIGTPSADVGSIGVFTMHFDKSAAMEAAGVKATIIKAGKYKAEGNETEPLSQEAKDYTQGRVDEVYGMFVSTVARARGITATAVKNGYGQGRSLFAKAAKDAGMIDRIDTMDGVLASLGVVQQTAIEIAEAAGLDIVSTEGVERFNIWKRNAVVPDFKFESTGLCSVDTCSYYEAVKPWPQKALVNGDVAEAINEVIVMAIDKKTVTVSVWNGSAKYSIKGISESGDFVCELIEGTFVEGTKESRAPLEAKLIAEFRAKRDAPSDNAHAAKARQRRIRLHQLS